MTFHDQRRTPPPNRRNSETIQRLAASLRQMQTEDGALPLGQPGASTTKRVVPYFGNFGAWGWVIAYRAAPDAAYLVHQGESNHAGESYPLPSPLARGRGSEQVLRRLPEDFRHNLLAAVQRWMEWNDTRRNPDGTIYDYQGKPGAWVSTKDYDSTDSYGSTYLELLNALAALPLPDTTRRWLRTRLPFARQAMDAMLLTQQKNGLTTAKPTWPVMYTMDNTEVLRGLLAAAQFFKSESGRDPVAAARAAAQVKRVTAAIAHDLWDAGNDCYLVGLQTDGGKITGLQKWYPDIMANLMALGWLVPEADPERRHPRLYNQLIKQFADSPESGIPLTLVTEEDMERLVWWGFAARAQKDEARFGRICAVLRTFDPKIHMFTNPAPLGHTCRLLAAEP